MSNFRGTDDGRTFRRSEGQKDGQKFSKEKKFGKDGGKKDFRPRADRDAKRRSDKISPKQADLLEVCDLDRGIIKLIAKRAKVIERMINYKSLDAAAEKSIRTSWEQNTNKFCPDPKIARELYLLIQSVKAVDESDYDHAYNLAPLPKPVQVSLQAPASARLARFYMAIAAAAGQKTCMKNVPLTDSVIHTIKSLNIMGGDLWFENNGTVLSRTGKGLQRGSDKIIHVGGDEQSLWLCLALSLGLPYHLKITGEDRLCRINFAPVAQFLAQFNARLVQVIPASEGLPVRIESSGMVSPEIKIPANLPMDFVFALMLAAPFWESAVTFDLSDFYAELAKDADKQQAWNDNMEDIMDCISLCSLPVTVNGSLVHAEPKGASLPEEITLPSDGEICTSFFLLPAVTSGTVALTGCWNKKGQQKYLEKIMEFAGLEFTVDGDTATAKGDSGNARFADIPPCNTATSALLCLWAKVNGKDVNMPQKTKDCPITESFLAHLGYTPGLERGEDLFAPFMAPSADWAVAYALAAYIRPRVKLVNPNILNDYYPFFWRMYNTLPNPSIDKAERKDDSPKPRRIIAQGVYADLPEPIDPEWD